MDRDNGIISPVQCKCHASEMVLQGVCLSSGYPLLDRDFFLGIPWLSSLQKQKKTLDNGIASPLDTHHSACLREMTCSSWIFHFSRASRPPKEWQERTAEKAKVPKIPQNYNLSRNKKSQAETASERCVTVWRLQPEKQTEAYRIMSLLSVSHVRRVHFRFCNGWQARILPLSAKTNPFTGKLGPGCQLWNLEGILGLDNLQTWRCPYFERWASSYPRWLLGVGSNLLSSRKCHTWKDHSGNLTWSNNDSVESSWFCTLPGALSTSETPSTARVASRLSHPIIRRRLGPVNRCANFELLVLSCDRKGFASEPSMCTQTWKPNE